MIIPKCPSGGEGHADGIHGVQEPTGVGGPGLILSVYSRRVLAMPNPPSSIWRLRPIPRHFATPLIASVPDW